jgi:polyisoprenoid-binding protein YceI
MKKTLFIIATVVIMTISAVAQTTWTVDNIHSNVKFSVSHLIVSEVEGSFKVYSGKLQFSQPDFSDANVEFIVDVSSINTDNDRRDQHLKSDDFFNAEKFPKMTFKSVSWKKINDQNYILEGDLTMRDVTKRVAFTVVHGGTINDPWGNTRAGFKATTVINRFDYNLKFNALTETGSAVVGKDVRIMLNLEFVKEKSS